MEDLELRLGSVVTELLQIKVNYLHSAFPQTTTAQAFTGAICSLQSRLETTAMAAVKKCHDDSIWILPPKPSHNSLFRLMVQHWGDTKALQVQRRISDMSRSPAVQIPSKTVTQAGINPFPHISDAQTVVDGKNTATEAVRANNATLDRPPICDTYSLGQKALKSRSPHYGTRYKERQTETQHFGSGMDDEPNRKDAGFWEWGSWF